MDETKAKIAKFVDIILSRRVIFSKISFNAWFLSVLIGLMLGNVVSGDEHTAM